jgi:hypothetical protein
MPTPRDVMMVSRPRTMALSVDVFLLLGLWFPVGGEEVDETGRRSDLGEHRAGLVNRQALPRMRKGRDMAVLGFVW